MIDNYQEEQTVQQTEPADASFADVWGVFTDGLGLMFDGSREESSKHYKCNRTCVFHTFDRVHVTKDSGSYVVDYPVGRPIFELTAGVATTVDNQAAGIANLQFYYATRGHLHVKLTADSDWVEFVAKGY